MENFFTEITKMVITYAPKILLAILTLWIGFGLISRITNWFSSTLRNRKVEESLIPFLSSIASTLLRIVVLISVAGIFGIETTSFVAILASAGLAVGLALQGSLSHFASGVMILTFRPYKVGDLISAAGFSGEVEEIQVFNTILRTLDNKKIIIPNGTITSGPITNITGQNTIRVDMQFNVSGSEDIDKVKKVILSVAKDCPYVLSDKTTDVLINSLEIGITKFDVRPWCKSEHYWETYYYMQENIKRQFVAQNVDLPTPSMNVNLVK